MEMKRRVYLDTTIPSYAVDRRTDLLIRYRRQITRTLLESTEGFEFLVSEVVRAELGRFPFPDQGSAIAIVQDLQDLPILPEVVQVAGYFRENMLVPSYDIADSLHLALAAVHKLDALATWNFRHLANPRKRRHLAVLCGRLGLAPPEVVSPEELMEVG